MPELPDLENFAGNLNRLLKGKQITTVTLYPKAKLDVPEEDLTGRLHQNTITTVTRNGKELAFHLKDNAVLRIHLMLNGEIHYGSEPELEKVVGKVMSLTVNGDAAGSETNGSESGGKTLLFSDFQKQLKISLCPASGLAPDALSEEFTWDYFLSKIKARARKNIKGFLLDQDIVRGIGNAYADEILYEAGISPSSVAGHIPESSLEELFAAISRVLREAVERLHQLKPDDITGEERSFLKVHNQNKSVTEKGEPILIKQIASRKTYYTEAQEVFS